MLSFPPVLPKPHPRKRAHDSPCTAPLATVSATASGTSTLTVNNMNMNDVAFEEFITELTLWYMATDELLREDAVLRKEFSCQVELTSFAQWQVQKLLRSAEI
jgi:hypothetical protein